MKTVLVIYFCLLGGVFTDLDGIISGGNKVKEIISIGIAIKDCVEIIIELIPDKVYVVASKVVDSFVNSFKDMFPFGLNRIDTNINNASYRVIDYSGSGKIVASGCLRTYATWMNELRPEIESYRMTDMLIPGAHGADNPESQLFKLLVQDIQTQLENGIRYIVIRPAYDALLAGGPFYIDQGITKIPISQIIDDIKNFIAETKEIIVVVIKDFPEEFIDSSVHEEFVGYIREMFEGLFVNPILTWDVTLGELWEKQQFIFLSYDDEQVVKQFNDTLFSSVDSELGDGQRWQKYYRAFKQAPIDIPEEHTARPLANFVRSAEADSEIVSEEFTGITMLSNAKFNSTIERDFDINLIIVYMMEFKNISGIPWTIWSMGGT